MNILAALGVRLGIGEELASRITCPRGFQRGCTYLPTLTLLLHRFTFGNIPRSTTDTTQTQTLHSIPSTFCVLDTHLSTQDSLSCHPQTPHIRFHRTPTGCHYRYPTHTSYTLSLPHLAPFLLLRSLVMNTLLHRFYVSHWIHGLCLCFD